MPIKKKYPPGAWENNPFPYTSQFKSFVAVMNQLGTNDPSSIIYLNSLPSTFSFNREGVGDYTLTFNDPVLTEDKTWLMLNGVGLDNSMESRLINAIVGSDSVINIHTWDSLGAPADDILRSTAIEIRVYS